VYRDYSPKGVKFYYIYKALAHPETNGYITPFSLQERLMHVQEAKRTLGSEITWLCDAMSNDLKNSLAYAPNSEFLLDPECRIARRRAWSDPQELRKDLIELVGPVENPTADVPLGKVQAPTAAPTGVVPRVELPARMRPLRVEPKESKTPFYAKLRVEVEQEFTQTGKGKFCITFFMDPLYHVHWNNLAAPLRFELKVPDGATVSATSAEAPKVKEDSDSDPREFLLEIDKGTAAEPIELTVKYFACGDDFCLPVTQQYAIHLEVDRDGGGRYRPRPRPEATSTTQQRSQPSDVGTAGQREPKEPKGGTPERQPDGQGLKLEKDANAPEGGEAYSFTFKDDNAQEPLKGILLKPAGKGPFPAVVINHGKGGRPEAFRKYGEAFIQKGYVALAPELTHAGQAAGDPKTFAGSKENAERILAAVQVLESLDYVDAKKLCMFGHSMGAFATVGTCTQTDKFKAAAITAGGLREQDRLNTEANVAKITAAFLILHGTDDKVVNVDMGKNFKAALDKHQKTSELKLFEGVGHQLPHEKREEVLALVLAFFEKHLKD